MTYSFRTYAVVMGVVLATALVTACDGGTAPNTSGDVLAQDTTLNLQVAPISSDSMLRNGDEATVATAELSRASAATTAAPPVRTIARSAPARSRARVVSRPRRSVTRSVASAPRRDRRAIQQASSRRRRVAESQTVASRPTERPGATAEIGSIDSETSTRRDDSVPRSARNTVSAVVPAGAELSLAADQRVCSASSDVGNSFSTRLAEPLTAANGTQIPAGATAVAEITSVETGLDINIQSISFKGRTYPIASEVTYTEVERVRSRSRATDARKVAGGAAVGAILGQVLGRNVKSTVIGAAGGAVAGAVVASRTGSFDRCLPDGGRITARLTEPLAI